MKQKINLRLLAISIWAIFTTALCITIVYYELFQTQVQKDLRMTAGVLAETDLTSLIKQENIRTNEELRITIISQRGEVLFDNDVETSENHLNRPEVQEAFSSGTGESVRQSDTKDMRTFYYAVLLSDGNVLRVATDAKSITSVFLSVSPVILLVIFGVLVLCVLISHYLTRQLMEPIRVMAEDLDHTGGTLPYKELAPFVERIREQHRAILAAVKSRQDFTANVSHELKTPITAISGYAELIENRMVSEEQQVKFAGEIRKHADRLVSLVNDIIRLSELDHKESVPELAKVNLFEVARERVELLRNNARNKNVKLSLTGENAFVMANRMMMAELLDNLVQNAIRYNVQDGKVEIDVRQAGTRTVLTVADTGIGIPKEEQERIFERFYRVDKSRSRDTGGTGLGLAIVKHIVELHEAELSLVSEPGKGTRITVTF